MKGKIIIDGVLKEMSAQVLYGGCVIFFHPQQLTISQILGYIPIMEVSNAASREIWDF